MTPPEIRRCNNDCGYCSGINCWYLAATQPQKYKGRVHIRPNFICLYNLDIYGKVIPQVEILSPADEERRAFQQELASPEYVPSEAELATIGPGVVEHLPALGIPRTSSKDRKRFSLGRWLLKNFWSEANKRGLANFAHMPRPPSG